MLNALSVFLKGGNPVGCLRAASSLERQGFVAATHHNWTGGELIAWAHPAQRQVSDCVVQTANEVACCVGPLWYRGRFGVAALSGLLEEINATGSHDESALRGNFALFLRTHNCSWLLNDALGFVRFYASPDGCFYSTSWLAACAYLSRVELDEAAAMEYVLLGAAHSERTPVRDITILPLGRRFDLEHRQICLRFSAGLVSGASEFSSFNQAAEAVGAHLRITFGEITGAFPGEINTALSGGFDSRLIVAGLLAVGCKPNIFVYGTEKSADVKLAGQITRATKLALHAVNKDSLTQALPAPDLEGLTYNALFFDGLPSDGIYDPGIDRQTRLQQNAGGRIALNGGGGEIFRNFFHLPDRRLHIMNIVRTFYRGFDPHVFRKAQGLQSFEMALADSMRHTLKLAGMDPGELLTRQQAELIYPLFRCHYWMSVNNSIAVRHGYYLTPLIDLQSVRQAYLLLLRWKNAGKFESRLIRDLHPGIAGQPSAYGFSFDQGPDLRAYLAEWLTCARPVTMRPLINAARRRLHKIKVNPELIQYCRSLLPGEWRLDPLLDLPRLPDDRAFARALAMEIVWRKIFA